MVLARNEKKDAWPCRVEAGGWGSRFTGAPARRAHSSIKSPVEAREQALRSGIDRFHRESLHFMGDGLGASVVRYFTHSGGELSVPENLDT